MLPFENIFNNSALILTEGAFVERLKAEYNLPLDEYLNHAGLLYSHPHILESLYRQYIEVGMKHQLPLMLMTPTRKLNTESHQRSILNKHDIVSDSFTFLNTLKNQFRSYSSEIMLGGFMGCKGDAYSGEKTMTIEEAYHFHRKQCLKFQQHPFDFLFAGIMPEINEATGMAHAMSETGTPYIISFMIKKDGSLLDGTSISDAIAGIDNCLERKPVCYMCNCVHPKNLKQALMHPKNLHRPELNRFKGIQANASSLSPEELNNCGLLKQDDFGEMIVEMAALHNEFGLKILGGCCGTNEVFLNDMAHSLSTSYKKQGILTAGFE